MQKIRELIEKKTGQAQTRGWIKRKRNLKDKLFLILRDETGELQVVLDPTSAKGKNIENITIESSVVFFGNLIEDERAPNGVEMQVTNFEVIGVADDFPIQRDFSTEFLNDVRHLWVRSQKIRDALGVRNTIFESFREFMVERDCTEVQGPMFVTGAVEGGSTLFEVPYFGKKVNLTQSSQFYLEVMIFSLGNVYTIAPSFRAEKSKTSRHLTEFWHAEVELPWTNLKEMIDFEEDMLKHIVTRVIENNRKELTALGRDPSSLEPSASMSFERATYSEILKEAQNKFPDLEFGHDLGEKEERELTMHRDRPLIITHYPKSLKPFYHRPDPENKEVVLCNDILAPEGYGEIIGSGERCWTQEEILTRLKEDKLDPKPYQWYIDMRKYGGVPHSGFGMGLDRITAWIVKADHIRDVIPFPRTMTRYYP